MEDRKETCLFQGNQESLCLSLSLTSLCPSPLLAVLAGKISEDFSLWSTELFITVIATGIKMYSISMWTRVCAYKICGAEKVQKRLCVLFSVMKSNAASLPAYLIEEYPSSCENFAEEELFSLSLKEYSFPNDQPNQFTLCRIIVLKKN